MHTGPDIHARWVYELVCEGDQQASVSRCVFARTGSEKKAATWANRASQRAVCSGRRSPALASLHHHLDTPIPLHHPLKTGLLHF